MPRLRISRYADIALDLHPYLIKYLTEINKEPVLYLDPKSEVGELIMRMFALPPAGWRPERIAVDRRLMLKIPLHYFRDRGLGQYISNCNRVALAQVIENLFWQDVCMEVRLAVIRCGMNERAALTKFREKHGILEEDYKLESMEKRYRRWRQKRKIGAL